ncbi:DsbA family protein [Candidatus Woesearchaeota archaeon]|nr:DsbA family protein [Candidatus Woesearchaeota archaeon]
MEEQKEHDFKEHQKEETVTFSKITLWKIVSGVLGLLLVISIFTGGFSLGSNSPSGAVVAAPSGAAPLPQAPSAVVTDMNVLSDDDPFLGKKDAPVTIVEFSDYECPFCVRFYQQTLSQIKSNYVETGKAKFVYRDFPLSFHQQAESAAIAANCAGKQEKYFEFHDKIFNNGGAAGKSNADYKRWAQELKLDIAQWEECLSDPAQKQEIQKDIRDGSAVGVSGTPGFIINGKLISGAQPFSVFQQVIEAELN